MSIIDYINLITVCSAKIHSFISHKKEHNKGPFKYYVSMFLTFLGPPTYVSINSTVNQQKLPFSDPTHPPLC